jgi:hypothetical protein
VLASVEAVFRRWPRERLAGIVVVQAVTRLLVSPWSWRNSSVYGSSVLLTTGDGSNLYAGNNPNARGGSTWTYSLAGILCAHVHGHALN